MKRQVERKAYLPPFEIDLGDMEVLVQRLIQLFNKENVNCNIDISLKNEEMSFESIEEIREYGQLKGRIKKFSLFIWTNINNSISLRQSGIFTPRFSVIATGDSEAWCAGAIATVVSYLQTRKLWYHWIINWPCGTMLLLLLNLPTISNLIGYKNFNNNFFLLAWIIAIVVISVLFFSRGVILPVAILKATDEDGLLKKRASELTFIMALISIFLTILGWFIGK